MKNKSTTIIISLLMLFIGSSVSHADDYLTITFNDEQPKQYYYLCDIDSMVLSKVRIDGTLDTDWCVQEIWISNKIYRYPLANIAAIDIKKVDKEEMTHNVVDVANYVGPLFLQHDSTSELAPMLPQISLHDKVEETWIDGPTLYVRVKDGGVISYHYPETPFFDISEEDQEMESIRKTISSNKEKVHQEEGMKKNAVVAFQPCQDKNYSEANNYLGELVTVLRDCKFNVVPVTNPNAFFYNSVLPNADIVFLLTHGGYKNGCHYLLTGDEIAVSITGEGLSEKEISDCYREKYKPNKVQHIDYCGVVEKREIINEEGKTEVKKVLVYYVDLSEHAINKLFPSFNNNGKVVMFNTACESLKGNNSLGNIFIDKGAACYLGYDDSNQVGTEAGLYFWFNMLMGMTAKDAYSEIPDYLKNTINKNGGPCHLKLLPAMGGKKYITYPSKPEKEVEEEDSDFRLYLKSDMVMYYPAEAEYGFLVSRSEDMSDAEAYLSSWDDYHCQFDEDTHTLFFKQELTDYEPGTRYYVKAVKSDSGGICESEETLDFVTPSNFKAYAQEAVAEASKVQLFGYANGIGPDTGPVEAGFLYNETGEPWEKGAKYVSAGMVGPSDTDVEFQATLTSLKRNVTYKFVACIRHNGYFYYEPDPMEFNIGLQITTCSPSRIHAHKVTLNGQIDVSQVTPDDDGQLGFFFCQDYDLRHDNSCFVSVCSLQEAITNKGCFKTEITNLTPEEHYYYTAALLNGDNTIYGKTHFVIPNDPEFSAETDVYGITDGSATISIEALISNYDRGTEDIDQMTLGFYIRKKNKGGKGSFHTIKHSIREGSTYYCLYGHVGISGLSEDTYYIITPTVRFDGEEYECRCIPYEFTTRPTYPELKPGKKVDLGLSVCWAAWNIGAINDLESGYSYSFGATTTDGEGLDAERDMDISGTNYDAATMNWGGFWRMPTKQEYEELINKCTFTLDYEHFGEYIIVTGPNGHFIRFPFLQDAYDNYDLWSGTVAPSPYANDYYMGTYLHLDYRNPKIGIEDKCKKLKIRAVCPK